MGSVKRPIYRLFIDETGNHHYPKHETDEVNRFLCLTGIIFKLGEDYNKTAMKKLDFENKYWPFRNPDYPIILHREEIVHKRGNFNILQDLKVEQSFNNDLLSLLSNMNAIIITVVLDKYRHQLIYKNMAYEPYSWCLNIQMQRFIKFLKRINSVGDIMIEARGKKEDQITKAAYSNFYNRGCNFYGHETYKEYISSKEIKLSLKKDNIFGLQVADIIGAAIKRKILFEKGHKRDYLGTFNEKLYNAISDKIFHNYHGDIRNWGETFLP